MLKESDVMLKPNILREQMTAAVPWLQQNPDRLWIGVRKGTVVAIGTESAAFEYRYHLEIVVLDYPEDLDVLTLAILSWARVHQPDLIFNPDKRARELAFNADILSNNCADILFGFPTDEAVLVSVDASGKPVITHRDEPDYTAMMGLDATGWDFVYADHLVTGTGSQSSE